jgi:pilus assembly protein CpaB
MTNRRAIVFFILAAALAIGAVFTARSVLEQRAPVATAAVVETTPVAVARADLQVGTALSERQVELVEWPKQFLPEGSFRAAEALEGRVLRRALALGEPILAASLLPKGSAAGLSSIIEVTKRAVSVKVNPVIGIAGFVKPGSRVDVLVTLRRVDQSKKLPYSKIVLQDILVLAIDQILEQVKNGEPKLVNVVTLEVEPPHAEKLIYAAHEGRLQLALRNPADHEEVKTVMVGVADLLGTKRRAGRSGPARPRVEVLKGSKRTIKKL